MTPREKAMEIFKKLESLGFFDWLSESHNLRDTDMKPEYLDELPLNDIHRTVCNSMAFRWFRNEKSISGEVYSGDFGGCIEYSFHIRDLYTEKEIFDNFFGAGGSYSGTFNTYEEAELACLIKLIEIVKEK